MTNEHSVFQTLKAAGYKLTLQRRATVEAVCAAENPMTPQALHAVISQNHPEIGVVTVYRTLDILKRLGLLCQFQPDGAAQRFKAGSREHHHHLVCRCCGEVVDFGRCPLELETTLEKETGFRITDHRLEFAGVCRACQGKENQEPQSFSGNTGELE